MRTQGVYTYCCRTCETLFAVVARFSVQADRLEVLKCPKCFDTAGVTGEGSINYYDYPQGEGISGIQAEIKQKKSLLREMLSVKDIAVYLGVRDRSVYHLMNQKEFPVTIVGKSKKVLKDDFLIWLKKNQNNKILNS